MVVLGSLLIARRQTAKLLEAIDGALHQIPQAVERPIKRTGAPLIHPTRDCVADPPPPQIRPDLATTVPFVAHDALGPQLRASSATALDRPLFHQLRNHRALMLFARCEYDGQRLARAVDPEMHLGAEAALPPAQGFHLWVPFFAPAACWWARMTVAST